ncbi:MULTISPECIES: hypothetical protein [Methylobacterium]|uniref:DUF308 domain-containing protein n=1 Tax=Methylobacterium bullatum TaxID=570505 RepID=A0A679K8E0_9HYPH|nr:MULTISPECIES: hypothetical protein [Methylobacterium]KQO43613.1 hypothetical protein ASF08_09680 [Methylobacterium sp. Leaf85]MBD8903881.1 hypothetical protein [Methylobacterium bullatum]GJD37793.1 hypothetical protein OICFNHDK_0231 [Methylobacterium bullatum]CAA2144170.1 hypothetical protein MBLL_03288 [Methylobacterium bullatum]
MILALFALAVVMIVGGIASVVQGFPYVRLESGWTMTIAGAATASSGALLLGLAVVATYLKRLERVLLEQGAGLGVDPSVFEARGRIEPPELGAADGAEEAVSPGRQRPSAVGLAEPRLPSPPRFADEAAPALPLGSDPASPLLPDLLPDPPPPPVEDARQSPIRAVEPDSEAAPARRIKPNKPPRAVKPTAMVDTVIPAPEPAPIVADAPPAPVAVPPSPPREADREEPLGLRSSVVDEPETAPEPVPAPPPPPEEADPAASPAKGGLAVVGTYASGGNTYVMYSNGSIEADTPRGQFTFDSLDELKAFVEAGGEEGAARGAA